MRRLPVLLAAFAMSPGFVQAQERATGTATLEQPPPAATGATLIGPDGTPVAVPRGGAVEVSGANVVVERETPRGTTLTVQNDVLFEFDQAALRPAATEALGRVAEIIRQRHPRGVRILGYTDSLGAEAYNEALSRRRAEAVAQWLAGQPGLPPIAIEGRGEREPVAPNMVEGRDNPEGRARNRRVEVVLER